MKLFLVSKYTHEVSEFPLAFPETFLSHFQFPSDLKYHYLKNKNKLL